MAADLPSPERIAKLRTKGEVCWSGEDPEFIALLDAVDRLRELEAKLAVNVDPPKPVVTQSTNAGELVSVYRCLTCRSREIVEKGNHHPWCLPCMDDRFDWANGVEDITREEAERLIAQDEAGW